MPRRNAFTLIEVLVVLAVIGTLASLLLPAFQGARRSAQRAECASNLRMLASAALAYAGENNGTLPLILDQNNQRWAVDLLPFLNATITTNAGQPTLGDSVKKVFRCPGDSTVARDPAWGGNSWKCGYGMNREVHVNEDTNNKNGKRLANIARPSRIVLLGDLWDPENTITHALSLGSAGMSINDFHPDLGSNYAFVDGHAEFLSKALILSNSATMLIIP